MKGIERKQEHYLELLGFAEKTIADHPGAEVDSMYDQIFVTMTEPGRHNGQRVKLFRDRGPTATIICGRDGRLTVKVSARRVLDYLNGRVVKSELDSPSVAEGQLK